MKALTFHGLRDIHFETVPDPRIEHPQDVIIRVVLSAVCGSDLHVYHGRECGLDHGTVMGHEVLGEILETGKDVTKLRPGQRVLCPFTTNCGSCQFCQIGLTSRCAHGQLFGWVAGGQGLHGTQCQYLRVPMAEATLFPVPDQVPEETALLLGDVISTGYFCADLAEVKPGGTYAVLGLGPIGLMAVAGAKALGAQRIIAVDTVPERLALAHGLQAETLDFQADAVVAKVREATAGLGVDAVLECVGSPQATRLGYELVRPGGTLAAVGVHTEPHFSISPTEAYDKNLTLRIGRCPARTYLERLIPLAINDHFPVEALISHRFPLSQGVEAYRLFDKKLDGCTKVILSP